MKLQDAYFGGWMDTATVKLFASKEESGDVDLSESETWSYQEEAVFGRPIARKKKASVKPKASKKSDQSLSPKATRKEWSHNLHVSPATIHHTEAVFSIVREIFGREHDPMDDLDVNMAFWASFLIPLFDQQFILDKTMRRIYDTRRIIFRTMWDSYSTKLEN